MLQMEPFMSICTSRKLNILTGNARVRIIMGMAYCLEHMHHDLNPPVAHPSLQSDSIFLTDDNTAKIVEICFWTDIEPKSEIPDEAESEHCNLITPAPQPPSKCLQLWNNVARNHIWEGHLQ